MTRNAEHKRTMAALVLAKKLDAACVAMQKFRIACVDCDEPYPNADDTRITLPEAMQEYSGYLESRYGAVK